MSDRVTGSIMRPNQTGGSDYETLVVLQRVAGGPWGVYRQKADGSRRRQTGRPCMLHDNPEEAELDLALWMVIHEDDYRPAQSLFARLVAEARSAAVYPGEDER